MWMQAKRMALCAKSRWAQRVCMIFNRVEDVWQLKWPLLTHLAWHWQLASLAYCIAGSVRDFRDPRPKPENRNREIRNRKNLNI